MHSLSNLTFRSKVCMTGSLTGPNILKILFKDIYVKKYNKSNFRSIISCQHPKL